MRKRLAKQIRFIIEIDKVKSVFRQTRLFNNSRYENDAEHAWHLAIMSVILSEYANKKKLNLAKVIKMVLIHDLVEIDAGDVFVYNTRGRAANVKNEQKAANRIFGLLPNDQRAMFMKLWKEFEGRKSPEAKFAAALDRMEPVMQNHFTKGHAWRRHGVSFDQVLDKNAHIEKGSATLWKYVKGIIVASARKGHIIKSAPTSAAKRARSPYPPSTDEPGIQRAISHPNV